MDSAAQPSPIGPPSISETWPLVKYFGLRYKISTPGPPWRRHHGDAPTPGTPGPLQGFDHLHSVAHPDLRATRRLISSRFVWKGLSTDVTAWACLHCKWAKIHHQVQVLLQHIPVPTGSFSHIQLDLVGPTPLKQRPGGSAICSQLLKEPAADRKQFLSLPPQQ